MSLLSHLYPMSLYISVIISSLTPYSPTFSCCSLGICLRLTGNRNIGEDLLQCPSRAHSWIHSCLLPESIGRRGSLLCFCLRRVLPSAPVAVGLRQPLFPPLFRSPLPECHPGERLEQRLCSQTRVQFLTLSLGDWFYPISSLTIFTVNPSLSSHLLMFPQEK